MSVTQGAAVKKKCKIFLLLLLLLLENWEIVSFKIPQGLGARNIFLGLLILMEFQLQLSCRINITYAFRELYNGAGFNKERTVQKEQ